MTEYTPVSCRVPLAWKAKLERFAAERHQAPEQIFYEAIAQYLGETTATEHNRMEVFSAEVAILRQEIVALRAMIQNVAQPAPARSSQSDSAASASTTPAATSASSSSFAAPSFAGEDWDDDEPDEILYDFLEPNRQA